MEVFACLHSFVALGLVEEISFLARNVGTVPAGFCILGGIRGRCLYPSR